VKRLRAATPLLLLLLTGGILLASGALDRLHPQQLATEHAHLRMAMMASPWLARLMFVGLMTLVVASGMPGVVFVTISGGMIFGILEGALLSTLGLGLGSVLLFLAARYAFGISARPPPALAERIRAGFLHHPLSYTLFLRLVPAFPFGGVTIALAWLRCPLWLFIAASIGGGGVIEVIESAVGAGIEQALAAGEPIDIHLITDLHVLLPLLLMGLFVLLPVLIQRVRSR